MDQTQVPQDAPSNVAPADNISAPATPTPENPATPATSPRRRNLPLIIALILFTLAIIGLTAAIIIATQNNSDDNSGEPVTTEPTNCAELDTFDDIESCIANIYADDGDIDNRVANYTLAIDSALTRNDSDLAALLVQARMDFLIRQNECDRAIQQIYGLNSTTFEQSSLIGIYQTTIDSSIICEDASAEQHFTDLYNQLSYEE